ncbi:MAG: glycosyltransferase [Pirellulales bacterium]
MKLLSASGIDVVHFASRHDGPLPPTQATAANQCRASLRDWRWSEFATIRNELEQFDPDILHIQFPAHGYNGHLLTRVAHWFRWIVGRPVVMTLHEHVPPHYLRILASYFAASAIISVRPDFRAGFKRLYSLPAVLKPFLLIPERCQYPATNDYLVAEVDSLRVTIGVSPEKAVTSRALCQSTHVSAYDLPQPEIADASSDHLLIIGGIPGFAKEYGERVIQLTSFPHMAGSATTGLLSEDDG